MPSALTSTIKTTSESSRNGMPSQSLLFLFDVLHHVLHPTLEQVAQAVDGVGGHALAVSDSIVGGTGKSHLFKAV